VKILSTTARIAGGIITSIFKADSENFNEW
jgi:hypothetical protein